MCLAIPGLVEQIMKEQEMDVALVDFAGVKRRICMTYTPEAKPGDYVLVHVGFAITIVNEQEAKATIEALTLMGEDVTA